MGTEGEVEAEDRMRGAYRNRKEEMKEKRKWRETQTKKWRRRRARWREKNVERGGVITRGARWRTKRTK